MMRTRLAQRPNHPALRPSALAVLCLLALLWTAAPASAQSAEELKEENARLEERVRQLESELEKARRNIELLSREIKRLRTSRTGGDDEDREQTKPGEKTEETETPGESVEIPDDPFASPRAYIRALRESYTDTYDEIDTEDARARSRRLRDLQSWKSETRRAHRGPIDWTVRVDTDSGREGIRGREAFFHYIDEPTGRALGDSFPVAMRRADLRRLLDAPEGTLYRMRGLITPQINISINRGSKDDPGDGVFIGPFAELTMDIRVDSLNVK